MIRILLFLAALAALAFGFSWIADQPGGVALTLAGYRYETSLVAALGFALVILTLAMALWSVARFVFRIPTLMSFSARMRRRNKGFAALTRGMLAAGAGDAKTAATAAREAERLIGQEPLAMLLAAQSAQLSGDRARAERLFQRMADQPETRLLGLRGLHVEARRRGDDLAANDFARLAFELAPAHWAGQAMLERHAMADDWKSALAVVETNAGRKIIDSATANRQRAVLKTAIALSLQDRDPVEGLALAREAIRLAPDLVPASVLAGQLMARKGELRRASKLLESAWRAHPHPDLARAYVDVRPGDSASDRLTRAKVLARVAPGETESALTLARAALEARDFTLARQAMSEIFSNGRRPTARMCLTMADIEETEHGPSGRMREWLARAARAARDPAWVADGIVSDEWLPASPVNGRLDAFKWETPVERIGHRQDNEAPPILSEITTEAEPAPATFVVQQLELAGEGEEPTAAQSASQPSPELPPENSHEDSPASAQPVASPPAAIAAEPVAESIKPAPAMAALGIAAPPTRIEPQPTRAYGVSADTKGRSSRAPLPRGLVTAPDDPGPDAPDPLTPPASQR